MTKATVAKLTVLIFLTFIVCLSEFFPSEVLQIQFHCAPSDPCDPTGGYDHYDGQVHEMYENAGIPHPKCEAQNSTHQDVAVMEWFACETQADLRSLRDNASITDMEVVVTLQTTSPARNVTVNGHLDHSRLHIEGQHKITLFGCRFQNNSTQCLFHLKDVHAMSSNIARHWSVSTILGLVLVLMVILLVLLGVRDQVFKNRYCCRKKVVRVPRPAYRPQSFSKRRVKSLGDLPDNVSALSTEDTDLFMENTPSDHSRDHVTSHERRVSLISTKRFLRVFHETYIRVLSPIPELPMTENDDEYDEDERSDGGRTEESEVCRDNPLTPGSTHSEDFWESLQGVSSRVEGLRPTSAFLHHHHHHHHGCVSTESI